MFYFRIQFGFVISLTGIEPMEYLDEDAPMWTVGVGIGLLLFVLIWIPLGAIYQLYSSRQVSLI